jgi:heterodisulfide reductase subunit B
VNQFSADKLRGAKARTKDLIALKCKVCDIVYVYMSFTM